MKVTTWPRGIRPTLCNTTQECVSTLALTLSGLASCCDGDRVHTVGQAWSAGMLVPPLHHSMAPGALGFIHVIHSIKPCWEATRPLLPRVHGHRVDLLVLPVVNKAYAPLTHFCWRGREVLLTLTPGPNTNQLFYVGCRCWLKPV